MTSPFRPRKKIRLEVFAQRTGRRSMLRVVRNDKGDRLPAGGFPGTLDPIPITPCPTRRRGSSSASSMLEGAHGQTPTLSARRRTDRFVAGYKPARRAALRCRSAAG